MTKTHQEMLDGTLAGRRKAVIEDWRRLQSELRKTWEGRMALSLVRFMDWWRA